LNKKWKILFTIPNFDTAGSGKALLNIATRLNKNKFEPQIACFHNKGEYFKIVEKSGIPIHLFQFTTNMKFRFKGLLKCFQIANYFKKLNIDLIHSFHYAPDYSEALSARLAGIPWIYTKKNMNWGGKSKNGWKLRSILAKYIIAQNNSMLNWYFPNSSKVTLIPRGVDIKIFKPQSKNIKLLEQLNILESEIIILSVANLVPVKGIEILLDGFELLYKTHDNIRLLIVGEDNNEYGESLKEKTRKLLSGGKIHFIGKVQNIEDFYSIADIFILPTLNEGRMEGCPVSLLEAMACGVHVLASKLPGIKDILTPFNNCLFNPGEISELYNGINNLLNDKKYLRMNKSLRTHIVNNYSIEKEVNSHEALYKKCMTL
jgi:glycosyltransferase involved in cell wall biosynthesis